MDGAQVFSQSCTPSSFAGKIARQTLAFIYHIERGTTLVSQKRRAILASLVGMPLALGGMTELDGSTPIDVAEYTQALWFYCDDVYRSLGTLKPERGAIEARTNQLETTVLQASGDEKRTLSELLGFYQITLAEAWGGQQPIIASALLSSTVARAKEEKFKSLLVYGLILRAEIAMSRFESTLNGQFLSACYNGSLSGPRGTGPPSRPLCRSLGGLAWKALRLYGESRQAFTVALQRTITKGSNHISAEHVV